jgi:transposase
VLHNDDTSMPVLALRRHPGRNTNEDEDDGAERKGMFTSGIVSTAQKQTIALFFTGHQHAGENLADVLQRRAAVLAPPMQMCDALSRNLTKLLCCLACRSQPTIFISAPLSRAFFGWTPQSVLGPL